METKKVSLLVRTGLVVIFDSVKCADLPVKYDTKTFINLINVGQIFAFGIGGDGKISLEIRLIRSIEPVLLAKGYSKLSSSTPVLNFKASQGNVTIGDHCGVDKNFKNMRLLDGESNFKVSSFSMTSGKYIIVFCENNRNDNNVSDIPNLEL